MCKIFNILRVLIIVSGCLLGFVVMSHATTALYRVSSNEVYIIDPSDSIEVDSAFFATTGSASYPDGLWCRDADSQLRVLGIAKIFDSGVVRNATQAEIDTFASFEADDFKQSEADAAVEFLKSNPKYRRLFYALVRLIVQEVNILRQQHGLNDRTVEQAKTALRNAINKDD